MSPQQIIAHYRITAKLGEGGMGEVWRATDTKLNRDVALKILPEAFANDRNRMARFEREAQVLASLNHPNIAAIYGVEERAIVMELVDGPTLADRIAEGPMPLEEALAIAQQIGDALEAAHEKGVVHRDLKPANVKVTPGGRVKLLDFGLAAVAQASGPVSGDPSMSPTLTMRPTVAGVLLGTAAYMSPEQARGKPVDKRADIWAFGVVLYEMLTGRALFESETISDSLAAVLTREPDLDRVPAKVRRLLWRCLEKDPKKRLRDIGEVWAWLEEEPRAAAKSSRVPWVIAAAAVLAAAGLGITMWRAPRAVQQPLLSVRLDLGPEAEAGRDFTVAVSPDGSRIAFPVRRADGRRALATRLLSQTEYTVLADADASPNPFFSPDSRWIGYTSERKLKKISVDGGSAIPLCDASSVRGGSWGKDGYIVAVLGAASGLVRIPETGGSPVALTREQGAWFTSRWPQILPGGQAVLFTSHSAQASFDEANLEVLSVKTGKTKILHRGGYFGRYLPTGHLIYLRGSTLFAVRFDLNRLETLGTPSPILEGIRGNVEFGGGQFDFSQNGTLVFLPGKVSDEGQPIIWIDSAGKTEPLVPPRREVAPKISPDGKRLAVIVRYPKIDLKVYDLERGNSTQLTFNGGIIDWLAGPGAPLWAPDSKHLAYRSGNSIRWIRADGAGESQILLENQFGPIPNSFFPDGSRLAYHQAGTGSLLDLFTLPLDFTDAEHPKPGKPEVFLQTPAVESLPAFSPDGHWIAYQSDETATFEIYVRRFTGSAAAPAKWNASSGGGLYPVWSRAGRQLLYKKPNGEVWVVEYSANSESFQVEKRWMWPGTGGQESPVAGPSFDLAPDGKRLIIQGDFTHRNEPKGNLQVTMLVNWFDEVRRRVPGGK